MKRLHQKQRIDKWLWHARFFKTRGLSAKVVGAGHVRVNGAHVARASHAIGPGDVLTFPQNKDVRVIEVVAIGTRRGPAPEAQALYTDLAPPTPKPARQPEPEATRAGGRPTKQDRRHLDRLRDR